MFRKFVLVGGRIGWAIVLLVVALVILLAVTGR